MIKINLGLLKKSEVLNACSNASTIHTMAALINAGAPTEKLWMSPQQDK